MAPELVTTRLLLVRHGESNATVEQIVGGAKGCTGLSELGRRQAARLRERFRAGGEPPVDVLYTSPMPRASQTAQILNEVLGLEELVEADLEEHRPGRADGLRWDEVEARFGPYEGDRYPHRRLAPEAESVAEFQHRVSLALYRLIDANLGRCALLSCHGGVIDVAFRMALGLSGRAQYDLWTLNASITELAARHPAGVHPDRWRLVRYNDAAHLVGLPTQSAHRADRDAPAG
ncbi:MAG: histidine phosphatase family protein [Acidimicrobiales bacterium]|nr:histidine phosphatase family protein [Acidimicrobiales bacterium]